MIIKRKGDAKAIIDPCFESEISVVFFSSFVVKNCTTFEKCQVIVLTHLSHCLLGFCCH